MNTAPTGTSRSAEATDTERDARDILDSAALLIWIGHPDGSRRWLGSALARFTGRSVGEISGPGWTHAVHPEDVERCRGIDRLCLAIDRKYTLDYRLATPGGRFVWMMDSATPRHDAQGRFSGHVGVCVDIDERRKAEEALADRLRRLRAMGRIQ